MTPEQRHKTMSAIKGSNTKPELVVRKFLWHQGFRYRIVDKRLPGKPDLVLSSCHTVIFVHGCFWHGHDDCKYFRLPKSNVEFWRNKINRNKERDSRVRTDLKSMGWNTLVVWECQLRDSRTETLQDILSILNVQHAINKKRTSYDDSCDDYISVAEDDETYGCSD